MVAAAAPVASTESDEAAIRRILADYARALESRDVTHLRTAYPGLTTEQADAWRTFFGTVSELAVTQDIGDIAIDGSIARVQVQATHDYRATRGERRTFSFRATLRREASGWRLTGIE